MVVVLAGGSPVETPWLPRAKAVLYTALGGEGVGEAVFQLLYGRACPAGRLAETWPKRLEDTPAARHWPMGPDAVTYNESIYVGYRYYDKAHVDVRFPFGYGLSYTSFAYSGLTLSRKVLAPGKAIEVLFTVENTGAMAGVETAQVYVAHRNSAAHQPVRTLAGFARVALKPGERKTVCVTLPPSALEFYDVARHAFVVEAGRYECPWGGTALLLLHAAFTARAKRWRCRPPTAGGRTARLRTTRSRTRRLPPSTRGRCHATKARPRRIHPDDGAGRHAGQPHGARAARAGFVRGAAGHAFFQQPGGEPPGVRDDGARPAV
ncbi:MAG: fibronectin type III-like domain-contianing protein [Ruthenibacterium lactatiformans]